MVRRVVEHIKDKTGIFTTMFSDGAVKPGTVGSTTFLPSSQRQLAQDLRLLALTKTTFCSSVFASTD
jgi:hypothetical protein